MDDVAIIDDVTALTAGMRAAAARDPLTARAVSGPMAAASRTTRSASAAADAVPDTGTSVTDTSAVERLAYQ